MSTVSRFLIKFASLIVCTLAAPITTSSSSRPAAAMARPRPLQLLRSAHRVGPYWLPGDPISRDNLRVGRRQPDVHEPHRGQSLHPPPVSQALGSGGAVAVAERGTDPWLLQ